MTVQFYQTFGPFGQVGKNYPWEFSKSFCRWIEEEAGVFKEDEAVKKLAREARAAGYEKALDDVDSEESLNPRPAIIHSSEKMACQFP